MKKKIAICILLGMSVVGTASANEFSFQKHKTIHEVLNNQVAHSSGMQELHYGMEVNMRCIASIAAFRNGLNPVRDTNMINNMNLKIGNIILMAALNYDRMNNSGMPSRNDWNGADLVDMFLPKMENILSPYLSHYENLLQQANKSDVTAKRYKSDMDTCADVASGYSRALKSLPGS